MPAGRPTKYKPEYARQALKLALLGLDDKRMASVFDVSEQTLNTWKKEHPEFLESLRDGKENADANVAASLYQRALGYSCRETDIRVIDGQIVKTDIIKHYPPDTTAAIYWTKNRQRALWRDKIDQEHTGADGGPIDVNHTVSFVSPDGSDLV